MNEIVKIAADYGLTFLAIAILIGYGLPRVVKYFDKLRADNLKAVETLHELYSNRLSDQQSKCEQRVLTITVDYQKRLDKMSDQNAQMVEQMFDAIHDFRSILEKQHGTIAAVRADLRPYSEVEPLIRTMVKNVDLLTQAVKTTVSQNEEKKAG